MAKFDRHRPSIRMRVIQGYLKRRARIERAEAKAEGLREAFKVWVEQKGLRPEELEIANDVR